MNLEQQTIYYIDLAKQMLDEAFGDERAQWISRIESELPPIRHVFAWLKDNNDTKQGLELAYFLQEIWFEDQYTDEGLGIIQGFLTMEESKGSLAMRAKCLDLAGALAINMNNFTLADSLKMVAITIYRSLGSQSELGYALLHYGHLIGYAQGFYDQADLIYGEALVIFSNLADLEGIAHATGNLAAVKLELGDYDVALELVKDGLKRYSSLDSQWDLALTLGNAAGVALAQGRFRDAILLAAASSAHRERIGVTLPNAFKSRFRKIEETSLNNLDEEQRTLLWAKGQSMTMIEALNYAFGIGDTSS